MQRLFRFLSETTKDCDERDFSETTRRRNGPASVKSTCQVNAQRTPLLVPVISQDTHAPLAI